MESFCDLLLDHDNDDKDDHNDDVMPKMRIYLQFFYTYVCGSNY